MLMKVYVVINEGLHQDSSYFDVIGVYDALNKAKDVINESSKSVIENQWLGSDLNNIMTCKSERSIRMENSEGYYEEFYILEREVS